MKKHNVYRKAAKRIFDGTSSLSCVAICSAGNVDLSGPEVGAYRDIFLANSEGRQVNHFEPFCAHRLEHRIMALLLMAEMVKHGDV